MQRVSVLQRARAFEERMKLTGKGKAREKEPGMDDSDAVIVGRVGAVVRQWVQGPPTLVSSDVWKHLQPEEEIVSGTVVPAGAMRSVDSILGDVAPDS